MNCITIGHLVFASNVELINCKIVLDILEGPKRAMIGFSTVGGLKAPAAAAATKQQQKQQKAAKAEGTRTARKTAHNKKKPASSSSKNGKNSTKSNNSSANILEGHKAARVCFSHNNRSKGPECGRAKPRTIKAKRCGAPKGGGGRWEEEECFPVEIRGDTGKFCLNWL